MRILLVVSSFNSLTQRVFTYLKDMGHIVSVEFFIDDDSIKNELARFQPDIILCPFLKKYIPKEIFSQFPTFILHPGIYGDRGHNSLDHAIKNDKKEWGVVILKANEEFDGGDIYSEVRFNMRDTFKASIYRNETTNATVKAVDELLKNLQNKDFKPIPQLKVPLHNYLSDNDRAIDWQNDTTGQIIKKIYLSDSYPGVLDVFFGIECYLFGAWEEESLKGMPKQILAKRDGAICIGTIDGAVWISHLKSMGGFKLPATYVLKDKLKGVKEIRTPLIIENKQKTFYEISSKTIGDVGYLYFNFHNGAMDSGQCIRLKYAFEYLKSGCKIIVLMGGNEFFSNGIHLNILEDSKKQGEDGWSNINAINDAVKSVLFADDIITVASFGKNAGAGGVFLGLACDYVIGCEGVVLNPHYKTMGLNGSEYHTYTLPKRAGEEKAQELLNECLPISINKAKDLNLVDVVLKNENYFEDLNRFCQSIVENEDEYYDKICDKKDYIEENSNLINQKKEEELKVMYPQFWDKNSSFHKLRYEFVYKICPAQTPHRFKIKERILQDA